MTDTKPMDGDEGGQRRRGGGKFAKFGRAKRETVPEEDLDYKNVTYLSKRWGLSQGWVGAFPADAEAVSTVLAIDEYGLAQAWVKLYGGPEGSGFVRLPDRRGMGLETRRRTHPGACRCHDLPRHRGPRHRACGSLPDGDRLIRRR